jgi:hypothetical protein
MTGCVRHRRTSKVKAMMGEAERVDADEDAAHGPGQSWG